MPRPTVYYIRHGETDWNVAGRLQGRRDVSAQCARPRAGHRIAAKSCATCCARDGRDPAGLDYVSSPLGRAAQTMELARAALGLAGRRLPDRAAAHRNRLRRLGRLHHRAIARARPAAHRRSASTTSGISCRPAGKATRWSRCACAPGTRALRATRWSTAHGGTARGLIAHLGIAKPAAAPLDRYRARRGLCVRRRAADALRLIRSSPRKRGPSL